MIAAEAAGYEELGARVAPAWMSQIEGIGASRGWEDQGRPYLLQLGAAWPEVLGSAVRDGEGWYAGTLFGDQADLALGPELAERSA